MLEEVFTEKQQEELHALFHKYIDQKVYANILRKLIYIAVMQNLKDEDSMFNEGLHDGVYWLSVLTEILDPTNLLD